MRTAWWWWVVSLLWGAAVVLPAEAAKVQRVSVSTSGLQSSGSADSGDGFAQISSDGRFVAFVSAATDLWPVDGNTDGIDGRDVFLRDRALGTTELVSVSSEGEPGNAVSVDPFVTSDGRYVIFSSLATSLVAPATPLYELNTFVRDRLLQTTELVVLTSTGAAPNDTFIVADVTPDGRYVLFYTRASNIVSGDTNGTYDAFLRDRLMGTTECVGLTGDGEQFAGGSGAGDITPNGRYVLFGAMGPGLYVRDRVLGTTVQVDLGSTGLPATDVNGDVRFSATGREVVFGSGDDGLVPGDTNSSPDYFLRDRELATTERVSVSSTGGQGQWPADPDEGTPGHTVAVSADGRYVSFANELQYLVPEDSNAHIDVFLRDRVSGTTTLVNATPSGGVTFGRNQLCAMSDDAAEVLFLSSGDDLVPGDTNNAWDTFVWDREARFFDVPSCYWAFPAIEACVAAGIVSGYVDTTYRPTQVVTRGQMAVYIARALCGGEAAVPTGPATPTFADVPATYWGFRHVEYLADPDRGIAQGYADGYHPEEVVSRAQMAVYVARSIVDPLGEAGLVGYAPPVTASFPDVATDYWAYKHIEYCRARGIVSGYADGYHPEQAVDRGQMAVYVARAFELPV